MRNRKREFPEPDDFESECCDLLNDFVESYSFENGCLGYVEYHNGVSYFSRKGMRLYEAYRRRLFALGAKLFPGVDLEIEADSVQEVEDDYDED